MNQDAFEPALEKVAAPFTPFIKKLGIDAIKLSHAEGEVSIGRFDQEMVMVSHQTVGMAKPVITLVNLLKGIEEILAVQVIFEDSFLFVAARGNMIHGTRVFYSKRTGHNI